MVMSHFEGLSRLTVADKKPDMIKWLRLTISSCAEVADAPADVAVPST